MSDRPRLLLLLGQLPQDPASGAAKCAFTAAQFLAAAGFDVCSLSTSVTEASRPFDAESLYKAAGCDIRIESAPNGCRCLHFDDRGVTCRVLDTGTSQLGELESALEGALDGLLDAELRSFRPHIVLTYGGTLRDQARQKRCRAAGAKVIFYLLNHGYLNRGFFDGFDAVITPSRFLSTRYEEQIGLVSTALPLPIDEAEVVAASREPVFTTFVNPSIEKGAAFVARLAEELCSRRPDLPLLVVEARGTAAMLVRVGMEGGFDLTRHESLIVLPPTLDPKEFWRVTRTLLVPSVWEEPAGRVVAEALMNGIPPIVSDRGGLPETAAGGGIVLPLAEELTVQSRLPPPPQSCELWLDRVIQLCDDEATYEKASDRARQAARCYEQGAVSERFGRFFRSLID